MSTLTLARLGELSTADWLWLAAERIAEVLLYPALWVVAIATLAWLVGRLASSPPALRRTHI